MIDVTYVRVVEWEGLYFDGILIDENDSIDLPDLLHGEEIRFTLRNHSETDEKYVMENQGFPKTLEELKSYAIK